MLINILISTAFYLILMYISVNVLGFLVRGLFVNPKLDKIKDKPEVHEFIKNEIKKSQRADQWINIIALILFISFFYVLFHFWNIGIVLAAIIIMGSRIPDLLWEIKHGKKMTRANAKLLPKNTLYYISAWIDWVVALPLVYFSLYYFN